MTPQMAPRRRNPKGGRHFAGDRLLIDGSGAVSWREYRIGQLNIEAPGDRLTIGAQAFSFDAAAPSGLGAVSNGVILRVH